MLRIAQVSDLNPSIRICWRSLFNGTSPVLLMTNRRCLQGPRDSFFAWRVYLRVYVPFPTLAHTKSRSVSGRKNLWIPIIIVSFQTSFLTLV
jgi:hypothetical protein